MHLVICLNSWVWGILLVLTLNIAAQPSSEKRATPSKEKGAVSPSGKFVPSGQGGERKKDSPSSKQAMKSLLEALKITPKGDGKLIIGKVVLDKKERTITFPAQVNMLKDVVEYLLVTENGKAHESVFTTSARPTDIHMACLLLGVKPWEKGAWPKSYEEVPTPQSVNIEVTWATNGPLKRLSLAQCLRKTNAGRQDAQLGNFEEGAWFYTGSNMRSGKFVAELEGSIIAVIADGSALMNGLRSDSDKDEIHVPNRADLPKLGRRVSIVITIPQAKAN